MYSQLPANICRKNCMAAVSLAKHVVVFGVGEGERAHGFTLIVGNAKHLLDVDDNGDGIFGESNFGEKQYFQYPPHPKVTDARIEQDRTVIAAFKEDGAILIDGITGEFRSMNYLVTDIRKGEKKGGSRHRAASAIAQAGNGCFVVKASEEVTKKGVGDIDIFFCTKQSSKEPVKDDAMTRLQKIELAGKLLFEAGEHLQAVTVLDAMVKNSQHLPLPESQRARVLLVMGKAFHAQYEPEKARECAKQSVCLWRKMPREEVDQELYAQALVLHANVSANLVGNLKEQDGRKTAETIADAEKMAREAIDIVQNLRGSCAGNAFRVLGLVVNMKYRHKVHPEYEEGESKGPKYNSFGKEYVACAIIEFQKSGQHEADPWCAVAYWNMYDILWKECSTLTGKEAWFQVLNFTTAAENIALGQTGPHLFNVTAGKDSLPWLKKATQLHEQINGIDHPFSKLYRKQLGELLNKCLAFKDAAAIRDGDQVTIATDVLERLQKSVNNFSKTVRSPESPSAELRRCSSALSGRA